LLQSEGDLLELREIKKNLFVEKYVFSAKPLLFKVFVTSGAEI